MADRIGVVADNMNMNNTTSPRLLAEILDNVENENERAWVYLPENGAWGLDSPALALESLEVSPEEEDDPDAGIPPEAKFFKLKQALPVGVIRDIVANAKAQRPNVDSGGLFSAFIFYYKNDAFIQLK